jgi:hypothetical protein
LFVRGWVNSERAKQGHFLASVDKVYRFEAEAKALGLAYEPRLVHHQTHSQPVMTRLNAWMRERLDGKHVEPNSGLGQAIGYMLKHWEPLTDLVPPSAQRAVG